MNARQMDAFEHLSIRSERRIQRASQLGAFKVAFWWPKQELVLLVGACCLKRQDSRVSDPNLDYILFQLTNSIGFNPFTPLDLARAGHWLKLDGRHQQEDYNHH